MNKSEKDINRMIPDATNRKRVKDYDYEDYYGSRLPDNEEFGERTRKDALAIILINVLFIAAIILSVAYCSTQ
jgi:hypothetical protein